jgi:IS66 C-terminal element
MDPPAVRSAVTKESRHETPKEPDAIETPRALGERSDDRDQLCKQEREEGDVMRAKLRANKHRVPTEARRINPFDYLVDVLARVQDHPASAIDELLPGAWAAAD